MKRQGPDADALELFAEPEPDQQLRGIRADHQPGADLEDLRALFVDLDVVACLEEMKRGGKAADPPPITATESAPWIRRASGHALAAHLVVAGHHGGAIAGREWRERRLDPRQRRIARGYAPAAP